MRPSGRFFNHLAELRAVHYPQDSGGGEVPTPSVEAVLVPCCIQQDAAADRTGGQDRLGSVADLNVFFRPATPPQVDAVEALEVNDRITATGRTGRTRTLILTGPAYDQAGRGVVWEARARDVR